jgi:hypothetical protein
MPLYHVQDKDRPGYVVAATFHEALFKWGKAVAKENGNVLSDPPEGVSMICDDDELIVANDWVENLKKLPAKFLSRIKAARKKVSSKAAKKILKPKRVKRPKS